jgi:hypothetical protein
MKQVELYAKVRYAVQIEGLSERAAARRFGIDPRTVAKMMRFSVPPGYRFRSQVLCTRYTDGGDSGSVVCDMSGRLVGLHFVGGPTASVFSPIAFVFDALGVELFVD